VLAELKEREPEQQALRKRVLARRAAEARAAASGTPRGPVATARRGGAAAGAGRRSAVAVVDRPEVLPDRPDADVPVESPSSVQPAGRGGTTTPKPGQRPQRPGQKPGQRPAGRKRR
jgi:preprotein translocase subunit SecF